MATRIKITVVSLAILVLGSTLCRAQATPEQRLRLLKLKEAEAAKADQVPDAGKMVFPIVEAIDADSLPAGQQPTPMASVIAGLAALNPQPGKTLVVYGSGPDARWEREAAKRYPGLKVIGIEIDPVAADSARAFVERDGLTGRIQILTGDATTLNVPADYGAAYLWPETLQALRPQIDKLGRFVSYAHPVPGMGGIASHGDVYLYVRKPPAVKLVRPSIATWNGRQYTHPVCNRPGCTMCAAIRRQLATTYAVPATEAPQQAAPARSGHYETRCSFNRWGKKTGCHRVWVED